MSSAPVSAQTLVVMAATRATTGDPPIVAASRDSFQHYSQLKTVEDGKADTLISPPPRYKALLDKYPHIDVPDFKKKPLATHRIDTLGKPCRAAVRKISSPGTPKYDLDKRAWEGLEQIGVISRLTPEETPYWTSALHLQLKSDGSMRPCGDYRMLNLQTELDGYPLPNVRDVGLTTATGSKGVREN